MKTDLKRTLLIIAIAVFGFASCKNETSSQAEKNDSADSTSENSEAIEESAEAEEVVFQDNLSMQDISFDINGREINGTTELTITPSGLEITNEPMTHTIEGKITGAEIEDLNADGSPELFIYIEKPENKKADLIAYSVNNKKSMSQVNFPDISQNSEAAEGYNGQDELRVVENRISRRFPIFENGEKTGKTRQITYTLEEGEAMRQLVIKDVSEY